ncbi:MAG: MBOAT family O-acyltransferase [Patescibacteria group bacterium]
MYFLIIVDYSVGLLLDKSKGQRKKILLLVSILSTCSALFFFKYFNFFNTNLELLAKLIHWNYSAKVLKLAIPLGLSFHTFQSLSYVIEVYRKKQKAERHLGIYALYVMFFPQLMAGPIERPYNMLHQFHKKHNFLYQQVVSGLRLMLWGTFQKVVIADRLASVTNLVFDKPSDFTGLSLIVAAFAFSLQIFCDFSGYSNIAIGAARVLGLNLMINFRRPYLSQSVSEFWRRWHISLSSWFKDYVYIPLGGSKVGAPRWAINVLITFLLSGLWHGANWTFVFWGGINGLYLVVEKWLGLAESKATLVKTLRIGFTFTLVSFTWIFFRANSLPEAFYIVSSLTTNLTGQLQSLFTINSMQILTLIAEDSQILGLSLINWVAVGSAVTVMYIVHLIEEKRSFGLVFSSKPIYFRWIAYYLLIISIVYFSFGGQEQFIYFQF